MSHGGLKRARSWKRRIQPKEAYSSPGLLYSEACVIVVTPTIPDHTKHPLQWALMTPAALACLVVGVSALALCCVTWYSQLPLSKSDWGDDADRGRLRSCLAVSALSCATSSAAIYVAFLLVWAYSSHSFNGRQPLGAAAIWVGLLSALYAIVGGLFARGVQRVLIVISSASAAFLWMLAVAASAAACSLIKS